MRFLRVCLVTILLSACGSPSGADFDKYLYRDEAGIVRHKDDKSPFTGKAYALICEECAESLFRSWPVHWVGEFKDGLEHGVFWVPASGHQDHFFEYSERESQKRVIYERGKTVSSDA